MFPRPPPRAQTVTSGGTIGKFRCLHRRRVVEHSCDRLGVRRPVGPKPLTRPTYVLFSSFDERHGKNFHSAAHDVSYYYYYYSIDVAGWFFTSDSGALRFWRRGGAVHTHSHARTMTSLTHTYTHTHWPTLPPAVIIMTTLPTARGDAARALRARALFDVGVLI